MQHGFIQHSIYTRYTGKAQQLVGFYGNFLDISSSFLIKRCWAVVVRSTLGVFGMEVIGSGMRCNPDNRQRFGLAVLSEILAPGAPIGIYGCTCCNMYICLALCA